MNATTLEFFKQRIKNTQNKISVTNKLLSIKAIQDMPCYVDCYSCEEYNPTGLCQQNSIVVPEEIRILGCGEGIKKIPF